MHELSLANEICHIIERQVQRDRGVAALADVTVVTVEVGIDANVEPHNLQFCLDALLATAPFRQGKAILELVDGDDLRVAWFEIDDEERPETPVAHEGRSAPQEISV